MKDLVERILKLRQEIKDLNYGKKAIQAEIDKKKDVLEELEKLTVNQLDIFDDK